MKVVLAALLFISLLYTAVSTTDQYNSSPPYQMVAEGGNPLMQVDPKRIKDEARQSNIKKKKFMHYPGIRSLINSAKSLIKNRFYTALRPISSSLHSSDSRSSYKSLESEYYVNNIESPKQIKFFHKQQSVNLPYNRSFTTPIYSSEKCVCYSNLSAHCNCTSTKIQNKRLPKEDGQTLMTRQFPYHQRLLESFKEDFNKADKHLYNTKSLVRDGIRNAKRNLLSTTRMARAFTSAAAHKTLNTYENTTRSAKLLKDLVKRGIITADSAAEELVGAIKDPSKGLLETGYINAKGAASYLMGTAAKTADSIINTLRYSPTAFPYLKTKYKTLFKSNRFSTSKDLPEIEEGIGRVQKHVHSLLLPSDGQILGKISAMSSKNIMLLRKQWNEMIESTRHLTDKYKEKFSAVTEDLSRILDVLYNRLGDQVTLRVPGIESLKKRFNEVLMKLKDRNTLVLTGRYSIAGLLDYSMGIFNELKEIDKAIIGLHRSGPYFGQTRKTSISSPTQCINCHNNTLAEIEDEEGYNHIFNQAKREARAEVGYSLA